MLLTEVNLGGVAGSSVYTEGCRYTQSKTTIYKILFLSYILYTQIYHTVQDKATVFLKELGIRFRHGEERACVFCFLSAQSASVRHICAKSSRMSLNTEALFAFFFFTYNLAETVLSWQVLCNVFNITDGQIRCQISAETRVWLS